MAIQGAGFKPTTNTAAKILRAEGYPQYAEAVIQMSERCRKLLKRVQELEDKYGERP